MHSIKKPLLLRVTKQKYIEINWLQDFNIIQCTV